MAKGNYREYLKGEKVRVKKYFYVLRPIFACMWIEEKRTAPPVGFNKLLNSFELERPLKEEIDKLLARKKSGEELSTDNRIVAINNFLDKKIKYFGEEANTFERHSSPQTRDLDLLFRETVKLVK